MSRIAFVNGAYLNMHSASVSIEDRGFQFGDAVYEVIHFVDNFYVDGERHLDRLERSLEELKIPMPLSRQILMMHVNRLCKLNRIDEGFIYIQVTRGKAPRSHVFASSLNPTLVMTVKRQLFPGFETRGVITTMENRWGRCDIKTTNLLSNVLAKQKAFEENAFECWFVKPDSKISEGSLSNAWIVKRGTIYTAPTTHNILPGVTRLRLIELAKQENIPVYEEAFSLQEAYEADEAFNSSSNFPVTPIVQINNHKIGAGSAGPITRRLYDAYMNFVKRESSHG